MEIIFIIILILGRFFLLHISTTKHTSKYETFSKDSATIVKATLYYNK